MILTLFIGLLILFLGLFALTVQFHLWEHRSDASRLKPWQQAIWAQKGWVYTALLIVLTGSLAAFYGLVQGTPWEAHLFEWMNLVIRVMHFTFGIAWIGASFYFVFLENALNRTDNVRDELAGNLWAIHGGGFYYLEKYKVAPKSIPERLHWFKYEAYFTWLSGFSLLTVVYYLNAKSMLIDPAVMDLTPWAAAAIGIGSLVAGWVMYDLLCKSPLVHRGFWFFVVFLLIATGFAYFYTQVFSARAAYIHFGAFLGTIMAANVFFVIIPSQKALVAAAKRGEAPDPELGKKAGLRSLHNNYFTLPVLFAMVSNHFPSTFGHPYAWVILMAMAIGLAGVKHYLNVIERHQYQVWILPVSVLILLGVAYATSPKLPENATSCATPVAFPQVHSIVLTRCQTCHSGNPTDDVFKLPPNGVVFETAEQLINRKDKLMQRVVLTKSMPLLNKTHMTDAERETIRCWIEQGAKP